MADEIVITVEIPNPQTIDASFEIGVTDHNALKNRDMDNQHPISSITGLLDELNSITDVSHVRTAISETIIGIDYNNSTGVFSLTNGYVIPTISNFNRKVDSEIGKGLSANDFTDTLKSKLDSVSPNADVNTVHSVNSKQGNVNLDTKDISENINLYYTDSRVDSRISLQKSYANGIASLDANSKIPINQIPDSITGALSFQGTWDASSGSYPSSTPLIGQFWIISKEGTVDGVNYSTGDWILYSSSGWQKISMTHNIGDVSSVNGRTGDVVLTTSDISEGYNLYYTELRVENNPDVIKGVSANTWGNHSLENYAKDISVVHKLGDEIIYGNKTFDDETFFNKQIALGTTIFDTVNPEFLLIESGVSESVNIISARSEVDNYTQINIQNKSNGTSSSSDIVATADIGNESEFYFDNGINNSNFNIIEQSCMKALDSYSWANGGDLIILTESIGKKIKLVTGGTLEENIRMELSDTEFNSSVDIICPNLATITSVNFGLAAKADLINGLIPANQLPSYVDDVLTYDTFNNFPVIGEDGKIYIAKDTNLQYRWSGSIYAVISSSLALGETQSTAYRGDRGKTAYDHSQSTGNPHLTTKSDISLGNVDNTSDANKSISTATQVALNLKSSIIYVNDAINTAIGIAVAMGGF